MSENNDTVLREEIHKVSEEVMVLVDKASNKSVMVSVLPVVIAQLIIDASKHTEASIEEVAEYMLNFIVESTGEYLQNSTIRADLH